MVSHVIAAAMGTVGAEDADEVVTSSMCLVTLVVVPSDVVSMAVGEVVRLDTNTSISRLGQSIEHLEGVLVAKTSSASMCCIMACLLRGPTAVVPLEFMAMVAADEAVGVAVVVVVEVVGSPPTTRAEEVSPREVKRFSHSAS